MTQAPPLPNFLVIGAPKAGTSSVARYLALHPEVCFATVEEPNFFAFEHEYTRGEGFYRSLFAHYRGEPLVGEKSWRYACDGVYPDAFARMKAMLPELRLVYVLRDPLPRALSMWRELRDSGQDLVSSDPNEALLSDPLIHCSSRYHLTYRKFAATYGVLNVKVVFFEDMQVDPVEFYREITNFLGIAPFVPVAPIHENRSVDQRSDGRLMEWMRRNGVDALARRFAPGALRLAARRLLRTPITSLEIDDTTRRRFLELVEPEASGILAEVGRSRDFWTTQ